MMAKTLLEQAVRTFRRAEGARKTADTLDRQVDKVVARLSAEDLAEYMKATSTPAAGE
jgi:hypothetical protein